jgi:hypothetical protein
VHVGELRGSRGAEDFDNLDELVDAVLAGEDRAAEEHLADDTAEGPDI